MVGIEGMGIAPVRANNTEQAGSRPQQSASLKASTITADGVAISSKAEQAAENARLVQMASERQQEIREQRVEEARRKIEEGTYKVQAVVQFVAARLTKFVGNSL